MVGALLPWKGRVGEGHIQVTEGATTSLWPVLEKGAASMS